MFTKIKKYVVTTLIFSTTTVFAHVTPEHVLGYSYEPWSSWDAFGVLLLILILFFIVIALSKEIDIE